MRIRTPLLSNKGDVDLLVGWRSSKLLGDPFFLAYIVAELSNLITGYVWVNGETFHRNSLRNSIHYLIRHLLLSYTNWSLWYGFKYSLLMIPRRRRQMMVSFPDSLYIFSLSLCRLFISFFPSPFVPFFFLDTYLLYR